MSVIARGLMSIAKTCLKTTMQVPSTTLAKQCVNNTFTAGFMEIKRMGSSLFRAHKVGYFQKPRKYRQPLDGKPFAKGVVLKTLIKKPKKPNSANRKCVLVRLSTGKEMVAYVPGVGHNLQEHNIVLCRVGRVKDCNGVKIKCVRGKYDLAHVIKPEQN